MDSRKGQSQSGTRRRRTRTTAEQLALLEESFARDHMPGKEERLRLVDAVGMTYKQIVVWFQNRRAKERSDERKTYFASRRSGTASSAAQASAHRHNPLASDSRGPVASHAQYPRSQQQSLVGNAVEASQYGYGHTAAPGIPSYPQAAAAQPAPTPMTWTNETTVFQHPGYHAPAGVQHSQPSVRTQPHASPRSLPQPPRQAQLLPPAGDGHLMLPPPKPRAADHSGTDLLQYCLNSRSFKSSIALPVPRVDTARILQQ